MIQVMCIILNPKKAKDRFMSGLFRPRGQERGEKGVCELDLKVIIYFTDVLKANCE